MEETSAQYSNQSSDFRDNIIGVIHSLKKQRDQLEKSKRCYDSISSQNLMYFIYFWIRLKKKYLEPYEKVNKSIEYKENLDQTLELYEKIKSFKDNLKFVKLYSEKESLMIESYNFFNSFRLVKNLIDLNQEFKEIENLKEDLDWFEKNEEKIINFYRVRLQESIKQKVKINKYNLI